jgi:hypothetical protein
LLKENITKSSPVRYVGNFCLDLFGNWKRRNYDIANTVVLGCIGRGGSTLLAQLFAAVGGYPILWEQLHWRSNPALKRYGLSDDNYINPSEENQEIYEFFEYLLSGGKLSTAISSNKYFSIRNFLKFKGYVHKFVNANMLLPWMARRFPCKYLILLRHPCAVVNSQIIHGKWAGYRKEFLLNQQLFDDYPELANVYSALNSIEEVLAFSWCCHTLVPLKSFSAKEVAFTTYEWLVADAENESNRIFRRLGVAVPEDVHKVIKKPSLTTVAASNVSEGKDPLKGWKSKLRVKQIENVLGVVSKVGIKLYDDSLLPTKSAEVFRV